MVARWVWFLQGRKSWRRICLHCNWFLAFNRHQMDSEATWTLLCSSFKAQWMPCEKSLSGPALWFLPRRSKKIQEVFFFGDAWAAQKNKVSAEGQRLAHASVLISDDFTDGAFRFQIWDYDGVKLWNPRRKSSNVAQVREKLHVYPLQDLTVVGTKTPSKKKWCLGMVKIKPNTAEAPTGCPASKVWCDSEPPGDPVHPVKNDQMLDSHGSGQLRVTCQYESTRRPGPGN